MAQAPAEQTPFNPEGLPIEDLPVGPLAQQVIHRAAVARHEGDISDLGGAPMFRDYTEERMTLGDYLSANSEIEAARKRFALGRQSVSEMIPDDIPEEIGDGWTPSSSMPTGEKAFDARERAANEHNDRQKD